MAFYEYRENRYEKVLVGQVLIGRPMGMATYGKEHQFVGLLGELLSFRKASGIHVLVIVLSLGSVCMCVCVRGEGGRESGGKGRGREDGGGWF